MIMIMFLMVMKITIIIIILIVVFVKILTIYKIMFNLENIINTTVISFIIIAVRI